MVSKQGGVASNHHQQAGGSARPARDEEDQGHNFGCSGRRISTLVKVLLLQQVGENCGMDTQILQSLQRQDQNSSSKVQQQRRSMAPV